MAALVIAVDQVTKTLAVRNLADGPVHLFWTLQLDLSYNSGAAFGLGKSFGPFVLVAIAVLLVVLLSMTRHVTTNGAAIALGLVLGGALGNLVDRLLRDNGGAVIDFIDARWWYVFNGADVAVVCGTILLLLTSARQDRARA